MASISSTAAPQIRALSEADLRGALALSKSAHWNQNEADWRTLLTLGQGFGIDALAPDGQRVLAASTVVLPYGARFAWVSMVLVLPGFRRQGHATVLLRHAMTVLRAQGLPAVLDATPAGHAVYVQEGFADSWGFLRLQRDAVPAAAGSSTGQAGMQHATRPLRDEDWPAIAALDEPAFGASRLPLLKQLAQRQPQAAQVLQHAGRITGFVLAREGRNATQVGPLVAADEAAAALLLTAALAAVNGPVYVDVPDQRSSLRAHLQALGFVHQRPFTRMVHGRKKAPGDAGAVMLVAGPELG